MAETTRYVAWLADVGQGDVGRVGGKNASLGEMIQRLRGAGVRVPDGFATTAQAYRDFLAAHDLAGPIRAWLARHQRRAVPLARAGAAIRRLFLERPLPPEVAEAIAAAYRALGERVGRAEPAVAVRSSATAEDLPEASFAGQQETFLNVRGERALLAACVRCLASLFTDRAIAYREAHGFDHLRVSLSVGVQPMVRSDRAGAGVMFSIDTETGFPGVVLINAAWGLGETVVQGRVDPDEYMVLKPLLHAGAARPIVHRRLGGKARKLVYGASRAHPTRLVATPAGERRRYVLTDDEVLELARWAVAIEEHYGRPMDMEWAKDGVTGELVIVQARPETVQSRREPGALKTYVLRRKGRRLLAGLSIGDAVATGPVAKLDRPEQMSRFPAGAVLVTGMTDPDWVPVMQRAAAIVTDHGGRTSHAAIVSRELGLPAIVGTGRATQALEDGQAVTVSCAEGDQGFVYEGIADVEVRDVALGEIPKTRTQVMLNLGNPAGALRWWRLPSDGVGLARIEFIIGTLVKVHPLALTRFREVTDRRARRQIEALTAGYRDRRQYFVDRLADGIARIAAAQYPRPAIVRTSDFKTNEYAQLIGGRQFEPAEENPMLGWRGASRYASPDYRDGFALECQALRKVREAMGLTNVIVMIPFCRTLADADAALEALAAHGLRRGERGLEVYVMCEIPSNVILAGAFAERFDGFSIGSNDLTQLTLGIDRDSTRLAHLFDENDPAVRRLIADVIDAAHRAGRKVGLCGQAPSDRPAFARFLVEAGIDSISVTPDSFFQVKQHVAAAEREGES
jgi:pyruvate,water dikinase